MDVRNDGPTRTVWGVTNFHSETGTEGGYWTVQDARAMTERADGSPRWSYLGLNVLETGDHLTIYAPESVAAPPPPDPEQAAKDAAEGFHRWRPEVVWKPEILWEGEINLVPYPVFTEDALGMWIHADQVGVPRDQWARYFLAEHICRLITHEPIRPIGRQDLQSGEFDGLFAVRPRDLYFLPDGSVRWTLEEEGFRDLHSERDEPPHALLQYIKKHRRAR